MNFSVNPTSNPDAVLLSKRRFVPSVELHKKSSDFDEIADLPAGCSRRQGMRGLYPLIGPGRKLSAARERVVPSALKFFRYLLASEHRLPVNLPCP
jgi:hypothetical protein